MKKHLIIFILFFFLLVACNKASSPTLLAIGKVDITTVCEEKCQLNLKLLSSEKLENIKVKSINSSISYEARVTPNTNAQVLMDNNSIKSTNAYLVTLDFHAPVLISKMTLAVNGKDYQFDIGRFQCKAKSDMPKKAAHLQVITNDLATFASINNITQDHYFQNLTKHPIIITDIVLLPSLSLKEANVTKVGPRERILSAFSQKKLSSLFVRDSDKILHAGRYLLGVSYIYEGDYYDTYFEVGLNYQDEVTTMLTYENYFTIKAFSPGVSIA